MAHLEITSFDYLKTPKATWTFHNDVGGSFSNSGMQRSVKAAAKHYFATHPDSAVTVAVKHIEGYDSQDVPFVRLEPATTLGALLGKTA